MEGYGSEISVATVPNEGQFRAVDHQSAQKRLFMDRNLDLFLSCSTDLRNGGSQMKSSPTTVSKSRGT